MANAKALQLLVSKLAKEIEKAPIKKATGQEWSNYLKNRGIKQEELQNFNDALFKKGNIPADLQLTPEDALGYHRVLGDVPLDETLLGKRPDDLSLSLEDRWENASKELEPKYGSEYSLAGAPEDAYKELVLHSPWAEDLAKDPSHYTEIPGGSKNIAWLRFHNREHPDVGNLFHLDELQSNRHQIGQREGYKTNPRSSKYIENEDYQLSPAAPDAPFKKDWPSLGVRRALIEAAQNNSDAFSWTPGELQQQRWQNSAGEGTQRFYDKTLPNILRKELEQHGVKPEEFTQIADPSGRFDTKELPESLAAILAHPAEDVDIGNYSELMHSAIEDPDTYAKALTDMGYPRHHALDAIRDIHDFHSGYSKLEDADDEMQAMMDWAEKFGPKYLFNSENKLKPSTLPSVKLSPEVRNSILTKGFNKYMVPAAGIGLGAEQLQEEEPEGYMSGGLVKQLAKLVEKEAPALTKKEKPFASLIVPHEYHENGMEVLKNPKHKDLMSLANQDDPWDEAFSEKGVRVLRDEDGNNYAWPAANSDHMSIAQELMPHHDFYATGDSDTFFLKNGKLRSSQLEQDKLPEELTEEEYKSRLMKFLTSLGGVGLLSQQQEPEGFASGGAVKAGAKALQELLENLHKAHPERLKRAEEAGYDTSKIWLHGTAREKLTPGEYTYLTKDPDTASLYSTSYHRVSFDDSPNVIPLFVKKNAKKFDVSSFPESFSKHATDAGYELSDKTGGKSFLMKNVIDDYPVSDPFSSSDLDDILEQRIQDQYVARPKDAKSIYNDFTPESIEDEKFAAGGQVEQHQSIEQLQQMLEQLMRTDPSQFNTLMAQNPEVSDIMQSPSANMSSGGLVDERAFHFQNFGAQVESMIDIAASQEPEDELPDDFDIQENEDGSAQVIPAEDPEIETENPDFYQNLVEVIEPLKLNSIVTEMLELIEIDKKSREKRDKQYAEAIRRSGLGDDAPGGAEFEGASKVVHPMIAEAAVDFASTAIRELFPADGCVKIKIEGKGTPEKFQKADRKRRHMNWQLRKQISEFRPALEQLLTQVPMGGVQYSKMYYHPRSRRAKFEFVPLDDIFLPFHAANFYSATRKTHRQRLNQIDFEERISSGLYVDPEYDGTDDFTADESASETATNKVEGKENPHYDEDGLRTVYEIYCYLELEEDSLVEGEYKYAPYILSIDEVTEKPLSLYRNWSESAETYEALDWIVEWPCIPWRGAYAIGLSHLIGSLSAAATGALRALLDSAHINNSATALKLKGSQISGQNIQVAQGQIAEIDGAPGVDDIRKIAMPLPFNPPSTVLYSLLGWLTEAGRAIIKTTMEANPDYSPNIPVGTQLSMVEQGLKVYSAIHARLHDSMERNMSILHRLNSQHLEQEAPPENVDHENDWSDETNDALAYRSDYQGEMDVQPVSDPNIFSDSQRYAQMGAVEQMIQKYPQFYDIRAYNKRMLQLMRFPGIEEILPEPQNEVDENPVTENIKMAMGAVAGVLPDQDHLAHIQVHMDFMMSPMFGQNPAIMNQMAGPWVQHMTQHMLMLYGTEVKKLIEGAAGMKTKDFMSDDPKVRDALSKASAAASPMAIEHATGYLEKVLPLLQHVQKFVQSNQPPPPMDPTQVAAQGVQVQAKAVEGKIATDQAKLQIDQSKTEIEKQKLALKEQEIAANVEETNKRAAVDLRKNEEDNQTALTIASMRVVQGGSTGNLKNGNSLDQDFATGGLVTDINGDKND